MSTLETVLLSLLVLDAIALTVLVLLQQGKGADAGASFGAGGANTVFGSGGSATFLTRATAWLAIGFFASAFGLAYIAKQRADSADSLGIPTVSAPAEVEQLTDETESVNSPSGDVPVLDVIDNTASDIPEIEAIEESSGQGDSPDP